MENSYKYFENKECQYYPCHKGTQNINCMFCYCPLYALGDKCGGNFTYLENGIKDCSACLRPHKRECFAQIQAKTMDVIEMVKKTNA